MAELPKKAGRSTATSSAVNVCTANGDANNPSTHENQSGERPTRPVTRFGVTPTTDLLPLLPDANKVKEMFGLKTDTGAIGLMCTALYALGEGGVPYRDFVFAMGAELEPRNAIEAMIVVQIALNQAALSETMREMWDAKDLASREVYERMASKFQRNFSSNVELLRRHRNGGAQTVRVEHVTVHDGGQAIVGNVFPKGVSK